MPDTTPNSTSPWALVLAGGDGTRLQGLTQLLTGRPIPKQYCRIIGERSMLEETLHRVAPLFSPRHTMTVVNRGHLTFARPQLRGVPTTNWIVQPKNHDTGPGLVLSLFALHERAGDAIVCVLPSDHYVADNARFRRYVTRAMEIARGPSDPIVLLGIRPDRIETGFGYIRPSSRVCGKDEMSAFRVAGFTEKPAHHEAVDLVCHGGLWSSFVMAFRVGRMLDLVASLRPDDHLRMSDAWRNPSALERLYETMTPWNFSRDVLARAASALVVLRTENTGWSDWGTPEAIERTLTLLDIPAPWQKAVTTARVA